MDNTFAKRTLFARNFFENQVIDVLTIDDEIFVRNNTNSLHLFFARRLIQDEMGAIRSVQYDDLWDQR